MEKPGGRVKPPWKRSGLFVSICPLKSCLIPGLAACDCPIVRGAGSRMTQVCRRRGGIGDDHAAFSTGGEKLLGRVGAGAQVEPLLGRGRQAGGSQRKPVPSVSSPRKELPPPNRHRAR